MLPVIQFLGLKYIITYVSVLCGCWWEIKMFLSFYMSWFFFLLQVLLFLCMFGILTIKCGRENILLSSLSAVLNTPSIWISVPLFHLINSLFFYCLSQILFYFWLCHHFSDLTQLLNEFLTSFIFQYTVCPSIFLQVRLWNLFWHVHLPY